MNFLTQLFVGLICLFGVTVYLRRSIYSFLLLATVPVLLFYGFGFWSLIFSITLAFILQLIYDSPNRSNLVWLFVGTLAVALLVSGHTLYQNIGIENVTNSQRGEHPNFQTSVPAKMLHNKSTTLVYYLSNLNDRLSLATIFDSGSYNSFSKFLPIGFLFPWYLIAFIFYVRQNFIRYLNFRFVCSLLSLTFLAGILDRSSADPFIFAIIWFIGIQSVIQIQKLSVKFVLSTLLLNIIYLSMFLLPINILWNI